MFFVSVTRLRIRSWRFMPGFILKAFQTSRQAGAASGNLTVRVLRDSGNTFWTLTVWDSESSMRKYMLANPHGGVMKRLLDWCDEAAVVHWTQETADVPAWPEAYRRLQQEGRRSKVRNPSAAHLAYEIPEPVMNSGSQVSLK